MATLPSGTVTFLFTDIEASTPLAAVLGESYGEALDQHFAILRDAIRAHSGWEFGTEGDSISVAFERARDAIGAAIAAQRALTTHQWPDEGTIRVRMGIHTGEPIVRPDNYDGIEVIRASRIRDAAHGSQILLSQATADLVAGIVPEGAGLQDLGEHRLKGLPRTDRLFQLDVPGLPRDFPPPRSLDHYINNLPPRHHALLGRETELERALGFVTGGVPVVTVTGPGGVGKTALAIEVADKARSSFHNGACFIDVAPVADPALLPDAVGRALGFTGGPDGINADAIVRYLGDRRLLLVFDNFEHVIEAAPLLARIAEECPGTRLLVTSRERLNLDMEQLLPLVGLDTPPAQYADEKLLRESPAVQLFLDRARAVDPAFEPSLRELQAIAEIAARLDGLPLAIQLAAARSRALRPLAMLPRMEQRLGLLTGGARGSPERHLTLRRAIAWSYDLLEPEERALLRALSVFRSSFSLNAAEAMREAICDDRVGTLDALEALINKSLLRQTMSDTGEPRFDLLETIREFAGQLCETFGENWPARDIMLSYYLRLARELDARLIHGNQPEALALASLEIDNIRVTLEHALETNPPAGMEIASIINAFWYEHSHREGRAWLLRLLREAPECDEAVRMRAITVANRLSNTRAEVAELLSELEHCVRRCRENRRRFWLATTLNNLAYALVMLDRPDEALPVCEEAVEIARVVAGRSAAASTVLVSSLGVLAGARAMHGDLDDARALALESYEVARGLGDVQQMALALAMRGQVEYHTGRIEEAFACYHEALEIHERIGEGYGTVECLAGLARVELERGNFVDAETFARRGLEMSAARPNAFEAAWALSTVALIEERRGRPELAVQLFAAVEAVAGDWGRFQHSLHAASNRAELDELRSALEPERFEAAWRSGHSMTVHRALEFAISGSRAGVS